ncbi:MAG: prepilin-type N-terminal cleavage/methylation domain-containing protein, partial [Phycisphaerae bacterium]
MAHPKERIGRHAPPAGRAFSLLELLVVVAIVALLVGMIAPALGAARVRGRGAVCLSNLRQLGVGMAMYANDFGDRCLPLAYWATEEIGTGPVVYWWGTNESGQVDHTRGFMTPYLQVPPAERSVYECPMQPWGSYKAQGAAKSVTSTYGYNGYYLSPRYTPGWGSSIGFR